MLNFLTSKTAKGTIKRTWETVGPNLKFWCDWLLLMTSYWHLWAAIPLEYIEGYIPPRPPRHPPLSTILFVICRFMCYVRQIRRNCLFFVKRAAPVLHVWNTLTARRNSKLACHRSVALCWRTALALMPSRTPDTGMLLFCTQKTTVLVWPLIAKQTVRSGSHWCLISAVRA